MRTPHQQPMYRLFVFVFVLFVSSMPVATRAEPGRMCTTQKWGHAHCIRPSHFVYDTCNAILNLSQRHGLNTGFFARLIWQESRFDPNALSHANARGIAQFIPSTARRRGLKDPYNPADALEHSAQYLAEMVKRYGNEGLAAIGYNGGERRAEGFLLGKGLAPETMNYVPIITGLDAEDWRDAKPKQHDMRLSQTEDFLTACYSMAQNRRITPLVRPKPPAPKIKPWGVQVGFAQSKKAARSGARRQTASCRSVIGKEPVELIYKPHKVARKKGYYFARYGRNSRDSAKQLCDAMRRQGCNCRVMQN
ncbi:lytic transglycosylase domain-containing protein [Sulfitobacter sp. F26204]|uniref:lytic transglycosylase domain-containing protein n=1 Tax=Sulfitobacter sp. F26204 TaxID=2996014 RepID=UPI00225E26A0|nr:lytic transglycosylase domain-containing protein [Sulfitobacter sp. F26204]MCX7559295.1 lytic transglycosylase domain-containing protein [Sulfitobacter sp. F26204]